MKKTSKLLSLLLAVIMVVGMLPTMAFAAGEDPVTVEIHSEDEWTQFFTSHGLNSDHINTPTVVKLMADIEPGSGESWYVDADVVFDLNGHTMTCTGMALVYFGSHTVTITDSSPAKTGKLQSTSLNGNYMGVYDSAYVMGSVVDYPPITANLIIDGITYDGYIENEETLARFISIQSCVETTHINVTIKNSTINARYLFQLDDEINKECVSFNLESMSLIGSGRAIRNGWISPSIFYTFGSKHAPEVSEVINTDIYRLVGIKADGTEELIALDDSASSNLTEESRSIPVSFRPLYDFCGYPAGYVSLRVEKNPGIYFTVPSFDDATEGYSDIDYKWVYIEAFSDNPTKTIKSICDFGNFDVRYAEPGLITADGVKRTFMQIRPKTGLAPKTYATRIYVTDENNVVYTSDFISFTVRSPLAIKSVNITVPTDKITANTANLNSVAPITVTAKDAYNQSLTPTHSFIWSPSKVTKTSQHVLRTLITAPTGHKFTTDTLNHITLSDGEIDTATLSEDGKSITIVTKPFSAICAHAHTKYAYKVGNTEDTHYHWEICTDCGKIIGEKEAHEFEDAVFNDLTGFSYAACEICDYVDEVKLLDVYTVSEIRLDDPIFYDGSPIPDSVSENPADTDKYEIVGVTFKKSNNSNLGATFERSDDFSYIMTIEVEFKEGYSLDNEHNISDSGDSYTTVSMNTPDWALDPMQTDLQRITYWTKNNQNGHWYGRVIGKPLRTAFVDGETSIDVTLPEEIAGKSAPEAVAEILVENARMPINLASAYIFAVYDCDTDAPIYTSGKFNDSPNSYYGDGYDAGFRFEAGKNYLFSCMYAFGINYGWSEDDLVITNEAAPNIISVTKSIYKDSFNVDAVIAANEATDKTISDVVITLPSPVKGETPSGAATVPNGAQYDAGNPTWAPNDTPFEADTAYTLTVPLTAKSGYSFDGIVFASVNTNSAAAQVNQDGTCTVTYTFPKTGKDTVTVEIDDKTLTGKTGESFSETLSAAPNSGITWAKSSGSLPTGIVLTTDGVLSGTPTESGEFKFIVTALHTSGEYASKEFTMTVSAAPVVRTMSLPNGKVDQAYSETLSAKGYPTDMTWAIAGELPAGLTLDPATGEISGTPTKAETKTFTVTATNTAGTSEAKELSIKTTKEAGNTGGGGGVTHDYCTLSFNSNGGSSIASVTKSKGTTVSLASYTPTRTGYDFTGWYSDAALNNKITSITLNSDKTVYAGWTKENPQTGGFNDVPEDAYYADAVEWAVENGVTSGTSATTFSPNAACTRAQAVTFLWRANDCPEPKTANNPFADVSADAYYYKAVLWAVERGITVGTSATTFSPDDTCTRAQIVTFLYRAAGEPAATGTLFDDVKADAYYADAVKWAVAEGITVGTSDTTFSPDANCTRAQIVTFIFRQINK